jgi:hypothetical protein
MLLKEVGKLREEKRALQQYVPNSSLMDSCLRRLFSEIGCLLCMKSKYGPEEFEPNWYV